MSRRGTARWGWGVAAWWGLTLLFASKVEICIPSCSGSSPGSGTEGSAVLGAERGGNTAAALGLCLFLRRAAFQLQRSLPTLPCLQPASAGLLVIFSVPAALLPQPAPAGSWQVPQAGPCCSVLLCLPFATVTGPPSVCPIPARAAWRASPGPVSARPRAGAGAPGGWIRAGPERCRRGCGR